LQNSGFFLLTFVTASFKIRNNPLPFTGQADRPLVWGSAAGQLLSWWFFPPFTGRAFSEMTMTTRNVATLPDRETAERLNQALADLQIAETVLIVEFFRRWIG
jgi:hypothetical protein